MGKKTHYKFCEYEGCEQEINPRHMRNMCAKHLHFLPLCNCRPCDRKRWHQATIKVYKTPGMPYLPWEN